MRIGLAENEITVMFYFLNENVEMTVSALRWRINSGAR